MGNSASGNTKPLVISIGGDDGAPEQRGFVEVDKSHLLGETRELILKEFDPDMLPCEGDDFYFCCNGVRLSANQEARLRCWDLLDRNYKISIHSKRVLVKRKDISPSTEAVDAPISAKKPRTENDAKEKHLPPEATEKEIVAPATQVNKEMNTIGNEAHSQEECKPNDDDRRKDSRLLIVSPPISDPTEKDGPDNEINVDAESSNFATPTSTEGSLMDAETSDDSGPQPITSDVTSEGEVLENVITSPSLQNLSKTHPTDFGMSDEAENMQESDTEIKNDDIMAAACIDTKDVESHRKTEHIESSSSRGNQGKTGSVSEEATDLFTFAAAESNAVDDIVVTTPEPENNAHKNNEMALEKSRTVLKDIDAMLKQNPLFCSEERRQEWSKEIADCLAEAAPETVVGVLGNTGVGKSSLLNALLDEASVLPTSGSRGCTAAVVELRFNSDLFDTNKGEAAVYKGEVEFITLDEWAHELNILVDECSTHEEKTIYVRPPEEQRQPDAAAAWSKIDQVYGRGTMARYHGRSKVFVYQQLLRNQHVHNLLARKEGSINLYNSILVEEGRINPNNSKSLLQGFEKIQGKLRRSRKKWALAFRARINDYVYRKGNGSQPQTWPLIRKVVLHGPWPVLSTGACLVDLPGVRDANVARAKVSEHYLQNCSQIWVVAPIKRAVDDGTAKELLGEQFKRRLLMDGQYGNVSFICTQTDDCEATETMRDHQDVATQKPGRWEKMTDLSDRLATIDKELADLRQEEEDLNLEYDESKQVADDAQKQLDEARNDEEDASLDGDDTSVGSGIGSIANTEAMVKSYKESTREALQHLTSWKEANNEKMDNLQSLSRKVQLRLKSSCAEVRNEYSKKCLQEDFRAGLEELTRGADEEDGDSREVGARVSPIPEDFEMDVYCISANDYLKIQDIKSSTDGPPNTFSTASDTQIPALRTFVHDTTAKHQQTFTESFASSSSDMLDRVKLVAADAKDVPCGRLSRQCKDAFETEMNHLETNLKIVELTFKQKAEDKVRSALRPALEAGATKGNAAAMSTVISWGSTSRRNRHERTPSKNGLYWSTYFATSRRDGVYGSGCAGPIDLNQELCDPMEKEFSADWQNIMDSSIKVFLTECEVEVLNLCNVVDKRLSSSFAETGLAHDRITRMANAANRSCNTVVKSAFQRMKETASASQRSLNRSLLPKIQDRMRNSYKATTSVPAGSGKFSRMKDAMHMHTQSTVESMFSQSTVELLKAVGNLIEQLSLMIANTPQLISRSMDSVYSVAWDNQTETAGPIDPELQRKVRECRDKLLPDLNELVEIQKSAMEILGIERDDLELDVMGVDTMEEGLKKVFENAEDNGEVIDLCDSDDDDSIGRAIDFSARRPAVKMDPHTQYLNTSNV